MANRPRSSERMHGNQEIKSLKKRELYDFIGGLVQREKGRDIVEHQEMEKKFRDPSAPESEPK